jgi:hypothetical protein
MASDTSVMAKARSPTENNMGRGWGDCKQDSPGVNKQDHIRKFWEGEKYTS